ncbi:ABC transporter ATP-binding protein [Bdellovibrionota bacterium FG-2]
MLLQITDLKKTYTQGNQTIEALRGVSVKIERGEFVSIMGPSGSGKSTLLHLIGGLDRATSGKVLIDQQNLTLLSDSELSRFRRLKLGFIFQFFNLLPTLTALENTALPLLLDNQRLSQIEPKAQALLAHLGLKDRLNHTPEQLSGGEMQRVAIARALISDPLLILADEPTGNLDSKTGLAILELLSQMVRDQGHTVIMVTHDPKAAEHGTRLIKIRDGAVEEDRQRA